MKAICPHWTPESLDTPKPWNWGCRKIEGGAGPGRMHSRLHVTVYPGHRGWETPFVLSWMGSAPESNPPGDSLPALLPTGDTPPAHTPPTCPGPALYAQARSCGRARKRDSLRWWHYHFLMFHKKGKANFYLRVIVWSRRDHGPWDRLCSDGPLPLVSGGRAGSGLE